MKHKVKERNDWDHLTYFAGPYKLAPVFTPEVLVVFPDGTRANYAVVWKEETSRGNDMGNVYSVKNQVPYIQVAVHGMFVHVKLTLLEIELRKGKELA